jgi:hypothetical protein
MAIRGRVWNDLDADGMREDSVPEPRIEDVVVNLYTGGGAFIAQTTTVFNGIDDGSYVFNNVPAGNYIVEIAPENFGVGAPLEGLVLSPVDAAADNVDSDFTVESPGTGNVRKAVTVVLGSDTTDVDAGLHGEVCVPVGLDIYYVLDISSSMEQSYPGATNKLEAAKVAISEANNLVESLSAESRVGLLPFYGTNPSSGNTVGITVDPLVFLTNDYDTFDGYMAMLDPIGFTPTAQALRSGAFWLSIETNGTNKPVIILLSDGVPSVSYDPDSFPDAMSMGFAYEQDEVDDVDIRNGTGGFLSITQVRPLGRLMPYGTYIAPEDGQVYDYTTAKPVADTMSAVQYALNEAGLTDLTLHGIAIQGNGPISTFNDGIIEYVAQEGNGVFVNPSSLNTLLDALEATIITSSCLPNP